MNHLTGDTQWDEKQINTIANDLAYLRLKVDLKLANDYPVFLDKAYPLGRCKEIRDEVFTLLQKALPKATEPGLVLIREALAKGATLEKVWGSLRGEYFQNAMILGDWYVDVSNDTVHPNKPRVEILPLTQSHFSSIASFEQFIKIARSYWDVEVYGNDICPALAPFLPLIYVDRKGDSWMGEANDDMLAMTMDSQFLLSERILATLPTVPIALRGEWDNKLSAIKANLLIHTQGQPVDFCQAYRQKQRHLDQSFRDRVVMAYLSLPKRGC
ncbi:hypothetical protein [Celerinatantimonas diazotrophica]|uniref:Uncharacterized protein n=1 Tax=Celerinatantimonas diazotrophica TaxID=412034 RepID=A0A4V2PRH0_9GAMM|nr:hypothetical protein [Celerinatantimonas diazotrophica]TCK58801.1 hypothetical protein EV690_0950 [Celerinatantimonas diazotrophica]CAG9297433.1 hypothetical protein CEDIAZO_02614 [Celerinatantimonas diazotrophica]